MGGFPSRHDAATGSNPRDIAAGDLDGDQLPELVTGHEYSGTLTILRNLGGGEFGKRADLASDWPFGVAVGDLNGDGWNDVASAEYQEYEGRVGCAWLAASLVMAPLSLVLLYVRVGQSAL